MLCPITNKLVSLTNCIKTCPKGPCESLKIQTVVKFAKDLLETGMNIQEVKEDLKNNLSDTSDLINYVDIAIQRVIGDIE